MSSSRPPQQEITVTSDASGNWGCGAFTGTHWFMLPWSGPVSTKHITIKELVPILVAAAIWGESWKGKLVLARCDNESVVRIVNHGSSKDSDVMQLMRCLAFLGAKLEFHITTSHIRGADNTLADALSRNNLPLFRSLYPQADQQPAPIPEAILDLVLLRDPEWTCKNWTGQWNSSFGTV